MNQSFVSSPIGQSELGVEDDVVHTEVSANGARDYSEHQLTRNLQAYLTQSLRNLAVREPEDYFPHLPGMDLLIAQAQQQQQQ